MSSLEEADKLAAAGATAPRISLDYIKSQIERYDTVTLDEVFEGIGIGHEIMVNNKAATEVVIDELTQAIARRTAHVTLCIMVMKNGFVVIGKSAPLSPENFDRAMGEKFAYDDCIRQLWPLFAFGQLQEKLQPPPG